MPSAQPMSAAKRLLLGKVFPWIVVLVGVLSMYLGVENTLRARASAAWPSVEGAVIRATIDRESNPGSSGASDTWRPIVLYEYFVDATRHEGQRISYGEYATSERADAERVVDRYPEATPVRVYYMPDDPRQAVLEPGAAGIPWFFVALGLVFSITGLLLVVFLPRLIVSEAPPRHVSSQTFQEP